MEGILADCDRTSYGNVLPAQKDGRVVIVEGNPVVLLEEVIYCIGKGPSPSGDIRALPVRVVVYEKVSLFLVFCYCS